MSDDQLRQEITALVCDGLDGEMRVNNAALAGELVDDWNREANAGDNEAERKAVLNLLRSDLIAALEGAGAEARTQQLRLEVYDRRVRRLSVQSLTLGKGIIEARIPVEEGRKDGRKLMSQVEALAPALAALAASDRRAYLQRELEQVSMEALYAIEGQAMSHRLSHFAAERDPHGATKPPPIVF